MGYLFSFAVAAQRTKAVEEEVGILAQHIGNTGNSDFVVVHEDPLEDHPVSR